MKLVLGYLNSEDYYVSEYHLRNMLEDLYVPYYATFETLQSHRWSYQSWLLRKLCCHGQEENIV
uniref:Uncharacterized protein n=1 Tax=Megaselia scalaris TaxID=36166 RepID=T1GMM9_MEGSC